MNEPLVLGVRLGAEGGEYVGSIAPNAGFLWNEGRMMERMRSGGTRLFPAQSKYSRNIRKMWRKVPGR